MLCGLFGGAARAAIEAAGAPVSGEAPGLEKSIGMNLFLLFL